MGKEKVMANEEKGRQGPENDAHLKIPSHVPALTTVSAKKKTAKKTTWFLSNPPPSPDVV